LSLKRYPGSAPSPPCNPSCRACAWYQDRTLRNLTCRRVQVDEIWNFVYAKQKNVARAKAAPASAGDVWTWVATDADTKLIASWFVGGRDSDSAIIFMDDLASRLASRVQLTSDDHRAYLEAVEGAFGSDIDYAMLVKIYGESPEAEKRYSPAECNSRRFTRLTNAFSKKVENHARAVALHTMYYNFVRIHQTLRTTPAMAAGAAKRLWEIGDVVDVLEAWESAIAAKTALVLSD
jgi:hypothetical protein